MKFAMPAPLDVAITACTARRHDRSCPHTSHQNGVAERAIGKTSVGVFFYTGCNYTGCTTQAAFTQSVHTEHRGRIIYTEET